MTEDGIAAGLALGSAGFVAGGLTVGGAYVLYPSVREHAWPMWVLAAGSGVFVLGAYLTSSHFGVARAGDSLVLGYGLALVLAASLVVSRELVHTLREQAPQTLGVKRVGLSHVQAPG